MNGRTCNEIFRRSIADYHTTDDVNARMENPWQEGSVESLLYAKNWIDTVQWHLEDVIRAPDLSAERFMEVKRRIDRSNQDRTDIVERLDDWFLNHLKGSPRSSTARMNSETPAWLVDRMSILALKTHHMREQTMRTDVDDEHRRRCLEKLEILEEQTADMERCLDELLEDVRNGLRFVKVYRQMKMYNDKTLNPELYRSK